MQYESKMEKKIGLVPLLYNEYNYGGILQLYALQKVIKELGYTVDTIVFNNDEKIRDQRVSSFKKTILTIKRGLYYPVSYKKKKQINEAIKNRILKTDEFKKNHLCKVCNENDINLHHYSSFICGSDQIWNPSWARRRCFLEFVPDDINKVIYAASLGVEELKEEDKIDYKNRIARIEHVSVREYSAKRALDFITNQNEIEVVADPTLLLFPEEWNKLCVDNYYADEPFILTYFLRDCSEAESLVVEFAKEKELKIISIPFASTEIMDKSAFGDEYVNDASPEEFLTLIRNAEYVFTDSFHACVFSTLFEKEFYVFERSGDNNMIGRIDTLQFNFHLPNRVVSKNTSLNEFSIIDYSNNRLYQSLIRDKSIQYLVESLNNE